STARRRRLGARGIGARGGRSGTRAGVPAAAGGHGRRSRRSLCPAASFSVVSIRLRGRKAGKPRLTADRPALVGWRQLTGLVEGTEMQFDLIVPLREHGRATTGTEMTVLVVMRVAFDRHCIKRVHRG